jgi:hypothetical protein
MRLATRRPGSRRAEAEVHSCAREQGVLACVCLIVSLPAVHTNPLSDLLICDPSTSVAPAAWGGVRREMWGVRCEV